MRATSATARSACWAPRCTANGCALNGRIGARHRRPIGIDAEPSPRRRTCAPSDKIAPRLAESLAGRALVIGVDRLDYSKGLPQRFEAFEPAARALSRAPAQGPLPADRPRSREEVDEYRRLRAELDRLAGHINGRFAEFDWTPLRYIDARAPRATLAGLYRIGRVGLVTPLRDGMNLVAKEFVAAQDPRGSRRAGAVALRRRGAASWPRR